MEDNKKERIKVKLPNSWEELSQDHNLFDNAKFRDYWDFLHQDHFIIYITSNFGKLNGVRFSTSYFVHIKIEVDEEDEIEITRMTQQGDSLKKTEMSNPTQNTKIPSSPATKSPAVNENYTSQYMPIEG